MNNIRIISLIPSSTEIVCALGLRENLVGRSHSCDYPIDVIDLPVCSEPRYSSTGSSIEIHNDIMSVLQNALSVYQIHLETIKGLRPTHIITQSQCEVCAVSTDDLQEALSYYLKTEDVQVVDLKPDNMEEVLESFQTVAVATEVPEMGYNLIKQIPRASPIGSRAGLASSAPWAEVPELVRDRSADHCLPEDDVRVRVHREPDLPPRFWVPGHSLADRGVDRGRVERRHEAGILGRHKAVSGLHLL